MTVWMNTNVEDLLGPWFESLFLAAELVTTDDWSKPLSTKATK